MLAYLCPDVLNKRLREDTNWWPTAESVEAEVISYVGPMVCTSGRIRILPCVCMYIDTT